MPINTLATATLFQTTLDQLAVHEALTGYMEANAGQVIYNGGAEVKIPKMTMDGMGNYNRDTGYVQGGVTLSYETRSMTQDRGRKFRLDTMDINENNFVTTAAAVMGEFQRIKVIPEIDAYRISKLAQTAITKTHVEYGYTPVKATIVEKIKDAIKGIRKRGFQGEIVIHINYDSLNAVEMALLTQLTSITFSKGGVDTRVPAIDGCPLIAMPDDRMYSTITINDGTTAGQTGGGYAKGAAGKDINFIAIGRPVPIAISKQDKIKIISPDVNQSADAWDLNYRRFHDLWSLDNKQDFIAVNIKDAE